MKRKKTRREKRERRDKEGRNKEEGRTRNEKRENFLLSSKNRPKNRKRQKS